MPIAEKPPKDSEYLSTLERGLSVLRAFDVAHPEMQLSEVAQLTRLSPAVARLAPAPRAVSACAVRDATPL